MPNRLSTEPAVSTPTVTRILLNDSKCARLMWPVCDGYAGTCRSRDSASDLSHPGRKLELQVHHANLPKPLLPPPRRSSCPGQSGAPGAAATLTHFGAAPAWHGCRIAQTVQLDATDSPKLRRAPPEPLTTSVGGYAWALSLVFVSMFRDDISNSSFGFFLEGGGERIHVRPLRLFLLPVPRGDRGFNSRQTRVWPVSERSRGRECKTILAWLPQ